MNVESLIERVLAGEAPSNVIEAKEPWDYPKAGGRVSGLRVTRNIPNQNSIDGELSEYTILPGVRRIPLKEFGASLDPRKWYYAKNDIDWTEELAQEIKANGYIDPLIVVYQKEGPYILEGGHRSSALWLLGAKELPALVVLDDDDLEESVIEASTMWAGIAHDELNPYVSDWVFRSDKSAKQKLFATYNSLAPQAKKALAVEVQQTIRKHHGADNVVVHRSMRPGRESLSGASASTRKDSRSGSDVRSFKVHHSDILLHWGQEESWLNSKQYRHEQEVILKLDAKPVAMTEAETPSKMALKLAAKTNKGFEGSNGAVLVGYQWIHHYEEIDNGQDVVSKKVSDWENAEYCKSCNRKIVHVYYVKPKGSKQVETWGSDHLHIALGYGQPVSKSEVARLHRKIKDFTVEQKKSDDLKKRYQQMIKILAVSMNNKPLLNANNKLRANGGKPGAPNPVWLHNKRKGLLMRGDQISLNRFFDTIPGWEQVADVFKLVDLKK